jgi:hypothetical protein
MMTPLVPLVAEIVSADKVTNDISAINIVDTIQSQGFPVIFRRLTFLTTLRRDMSDASLVDVQLTVTLDGQELAKAVHVLNFEQGDIAKDIARIEGFVIPKAGLLKFVLSTIGGAPITQYSTPVSLVAQPTVAPTPTI